ncbi:transposase for insertion sequence element isrm3 [Salmonella enterica subsp. enterica serovar Agona str. 22.H.04]|nr:transposase for insertion sequence element isrm3 [Salmonella enterica subsp. enterica serovar Agona str. 22.H.04]
MDEKKLKALAAELAKGLKTEADLNPFSRMLTKLTVETALNAELTAPPGHEKNAPKTGSNTRNGYSSKTVLCNNSEIELNSSSKTVLCDDGEIELNTPRDRENTFEPQLLKKHQTRITQMDSQILSLCAKGMTTREIVATFKEMYDADVSPTRISKVTDAVKEQVTEWQNRQLDALYPIVYMDCM